MILVAKRLLHVGLFSGMILALSEKYLHHETYKMDQLC